MAAKEPTASSSQYLPVYLTAFFGLSLQPMIMFVVPLWALHLGASPLLIGLAVGASSILPIFYSISFASLIEQFGSRRIQIAGSLAASALLLLHLVFPSIWLLILLQLLFGQAHAVMWIGAQTYVSKLGKKANNISFVSLFSFATHLGTFVGPFFLGVVWDLKGPTWAFIVLTLWSLFFLIASAFMHSEEEDRKPDDKPSTLYSWEHIRGNLIPKASDYKRAFRLLAVPAVMVVIYGTFLRLAAYSMRGSFYLVYLKHLAYSATAISVLYSMFGFVATFSSLSVKFLLKYTEAKKLLFIVSAGAVIPLVLPPLFENFWILLSLTVVSGFFLGITLPLLISIMSEGVGQGDQGMGVSLREIGNRLASFSVPFIFGIFVQWTGLEKSFFLVGVLVLVPMAVLAPYMLRKARTKAFREGVPVNR